MVSSTTGINDNVVVKVYPNPTSGVLILENIEAYSQLVIVDITGKEVIKQALKINKLDIDLSDYPSGSYLIILSNQDGQSSEYKVVLE